MGLGIDGFVALSLALSHRDARISLGGTGRAAARDGLL